MLNPYKPPLKDKEEILRGMYEEKPLSQAQEGDEFVSSGTVLSIENAMTVKKCRTCNSTVGKESAACGKCQDRRFRELLVVSVTLSDGTRKIRAAFFDAQARELLDIKDSGIGVETVIDLKREYLIGKTVKGVFASKTNTFSGELEATARHIISVA